MRSVLRLRDVRLLLAAGLVSQTGDWMLRTGIGYQIYALTGSTVAAALSVLASLAPQVLLGSIAGAYVDRWNRRRVMIVINLALAVVLVPLFFVHSAEQVWLVYLVLAASSCLSPFFLAAEATMLPSMITDPRTRITGNALNGQVRDVSRLLGAALGGVAAAAGGIAAVAGADLLTFVLAVGLLSLITRQKQVTVSHRPRLLADLREGFVLIGRRRALVVILAFMAVTGVGEAIMGTLIAPFVHDVIGTGAQNYGLIVAAQAVGGIVGGLVITVVGSRFRARTLFGWGALAFGVLDLALFCYPLLYGRSDVAVWPAMALIAAVGLPAAALNAGMITVLQSATEDRNRGRVFGTVTAAQNATMLATTAVAGSAAAVLGIVPVLVVQGFSYCLAGALVMIGLRPDRSTDRLAERSADRADSDLSDLSCQPKLAGPAQPQAEESVARCV